MGTELKVMIVIDSSDIGCLMRLIEDGTIKRMNIASRQEDTSDPREFAKSVREDPPSMRRHQKVNGVRAVECIVTIMQRKPHAPWAQSKVAELLHAEFEYSTNTISGAVTTLVRNEYVFRDHNGFIQLTEKGKSHPQNDPLPFQTGTSAQEEIH